MSYSVFLRRSYSKTAAQAQLSGRQSGPFAALLAQDRFADIPTTMMGFEVEMREAIWALAGVLGDEQSHVWALESLLEEDLCSHANVINDLVSKTPSEAQPAINQAIGVLLEESNALQALLMEIEAKNTTGEMAVLGSFEVQVGCQQVNQGQESEQVLPASPVGQEVS